MNTWHRGISCLLCGMILLQFMPCRVAATSDAASCDSATSSPALRNAALLFLKPHANTPATQALVRKTLQQHKIDIVSEVEIDAKTIEKRKLVDRHYYAIASKATLVPAAQVPVPHDVFEQHFGEAWERVVREKRALNAVEACRAWDLTAEELGHVWQQAADTTVKLGGGFYCAQIVRPGDDKKYYVLNGFFLTLREQFVQPGASVYCWEIAWNASDLSWHNFRTHVVGPTDPHQAPRGSLRRRILQQHKALGLSETPHKGLNGVHGSASPWEGLVERVNWLQRRGWRDDAYGAALLEAGLPRSLLDAWSKDPRIRLDGEGDSVGSVFDALEEFDATECLEEMVRLSSLQ